MGRANVIRRFLGDGVVVEVDMHVGQHRARGLRTLDPFQRAGQMRVGGVRRAAQRVEYPAIEAFEIGPCLFGNVRDVRQIGQPADPKAERVDIAVLDAEGLKLDRAARAGDLEGPLAMDRFQLATGCRR